MNLSIPHPPEDWFDDDELENDPEFQAWLAIADATEEDSTGQASSSVWVPRNAAAQKRANKLSAFGGSADLTAEV